MKKGRTQKQIKIYKDNCRTIVYNNKFRCEICGKKIYAGHITGWNFDHIITGKKTDFEFENLFLFICQESHSHRHHGGNRKNSCVIHFDKYYKLEENELGNYYKKFLEIKRPSWLQYIKKY
jgi:hypothetical protein